MYSYEILPEVGEYVDGLPADALPFYAELITFLELTPWDGLPYKDDPDGAMRKVIFGAHAEGIVVYLILQQQRRVIVLSVTWVD